MAPTPPTILLHKTSFLTSQTLQLSQSLTPSTAWYTLNTRSGDAALTEKAVDDALYKLNHKLQQHLRRCYAPQATRNVAEQIEAIFLNAGDDGREADEEEEGDVREGGTLREGVDLTLDTTISSLPPTWDVLSPSQSQSQPPEAQRYTELQSRLTALSARRKEAQARVERLRNMQTLLAPFGSGVQENLVTRNGALEKELERMRMLLVRVAGRIGGLPDARHDEGVDVVEDLDEVERRKVQSLLDGL